MQVGETPTMTFFWESEPWKIFDYDNVLLLPRKCRVESRSECNASVNWVHGTSKLPVVPANMKTVLTNPSASIWQPMVTST